MAYQAKHGTVELDIRDGVAYVTLNRPKERNAINGDMQWDLNALWPELNNDRSVHVIVVTGKGTAFSDATGETAKEPALTPVALDPIRTYERKPDPSLAAKGIGVMPQVQGLRYVGIPDRTAGRPAKPMIVAVNGACSGLGLTFIAYADIVVCADDAQFFSARANASEAPLEETLAMVHLGSLRSHEWLRMAYMGAKYKVTAQRATQLGMANEVVAKAQLMHRVEQMAGYIKEASPAAVRAVVAGYWRTVSKPYKESLHIAPLDAQQARHMDGKEGYLAWDENRKPEWPSKTLFPWPPAWDPKIMKF